MGAMLVDVVYVYRGAALEDKPRFRRNFLRAPQRHQQLGPRRGEVVLRRDLLGGRQRHLELGVACSSALPEPA